MEVTSAIAPGPSNNNSLYYCSAVSKQFLNDTPGVKAHLVPYMFYAVVS